MKRLMTAATCAGLLAWVSPLLASPERLTPAEIRPNLFATCFVSPQEGWVIGDRGRVLRTTDGGKTFERLETGTVRALLSIACFPDKSLVVVGQIGTILRSADGGQTWKAEQSGTERNLVSVAFTSKEVGLAVGDMGTILRTTDGGSSWQKIAVPEQIPLPEEVAETIAPGDILLYDVTFPSPERAWIVGEFGVIFSSTDGGLSFSAQQSPVQSTLFGVTFTDAEHGWAVGLSGIMLRTQDGGQHWERQQVPARPGFTLSLYMVTVRGQYAWAIGDSGFLLASKDSGTTWTLLDVPIQMAGTWLRGVALMPDGRGLIVGQEGLMLAIDRDTFTPLRKL